MTKPSVPSHPPGRRVRLRHLIHVDRAHTDLPLPIGGDRWAWFRQTMQRTAIPEPVRATLAQAEVVIGTDAKGRRQSVVHGRGVLERIARSGRAEQIPMLSVMLDGTARRAFPHVALEGDAIDADLALLAVLVEVAKKTGDETP